MSDIIVKDENALHKLKDAVLAQTDSVNDALSKFEARGTAITAEQQSLKDELTRTQAALENANARMDAMDKALPKGSKGYLANESAETAGARVRRKVGELVVDLARVARGQAEKFGAVTELRTQKEGDTSFGATPDAGGGYLVPPETANEIIRLVSNYGLARRLCRIMPMTREVMRLPMATYMPTTLVGSNFITPSSNGPYGAESSAVGQSTQNFTRPELVAARCMAIDNVSIEVDEDSDPSLMNFLVDAFAEAVALAEDWQVLRAERTPFDGIMATVGTLASGIYTLPSSSAFNFKHTTYKDLIGIYNTVDEKVQESGSWVMSNYAWNQIQVAMVDTNGRPFNLSDTQSSVSGVAPKTIFGRPVYLSTMMPKASNDATGNKFIIYGDFKYSIFGDRRRLAVDISPHAGFTTGDLVLRVLERFAVKNLYLATAAAQGAFAVGKTA